MTEFNYVVKKQKEIDKLKSELEWYRSYGAFVNCYHNNVDAEACDYADNEKDKIC